MEKQFHWGGNMGGRGWHEVSFSLSLKEWSLVFQANNENNDSEIVLIIGDVLPKKVMVQWTMPFLGLKICNSSCCELYLAFWYGES